MNPNVHYDPVVLAGIVLFIVGFIYFFPTIVACIRQHHQRLAIFVLNLFAGWTCVAWLAALVWACTYVKHE